MQQAGSGGDHLKVAVLGATGRMGMAIIGLVAASTDLQLVAAATEPGHPRLGEDAGSIAGIGRLGVTLGDAPAAAVAGADVAIDFTTVAAVAGHLDACRQARCALVMGTTGLDAGHQRLLAEAGRDIPVVYGRNMSIGVLVFTELARVAARLLGADADIEIIEAHHRHKLDAPSGTALQLGEAVATELGQRLEDIAVHDRFSTRGARRPGSIGFSSVRAGRIVGDHEILFALDEEILRLEHRALDRATFARGALRAARWTAGRAPGLYGMEEVLGLAGAAG